MTAALSLSDDPEERQSQFILVREAYEAAVNQNQLDLAEGRAPRHSQELVEALAHEVHTARAAADELTRRAL